MSGSLSHSQAKVIQYLLFDLTAAGCSDPRDNTTWPVFAYNEPDKPDDCVTIYDTTGIHQGKTQFDGEVQERHGIQIRVRSMNGKTGRTKARAIIVALDPIKQRTVSVEAEATYTICSISRTSDVLSLGKEQETDRNLFTVNCTVAFRQVS